jgi:hypothetical protein
MKYEFLLSSLRLPVVAADYRFDLDGNGVTDNRLGQTIAALTQQGLDMQATVDDAVHDGRVLTLFTLFAERELTADQPAELRVVRALSTGAADPLAVPVTLKGKLEATKFVPTAPVENADLTTWILELPLGPGVPVRLAVQWPRFEFKIDPSGTRLVGGMLNGSLSGRTVFDDFVPSLASLFTHCIKTDPESELSKTIKMLFDTGGCRNPDGTTAVRNDGIISPCEVGENSLIQSLLAPDVRMRSAAGKYEPLPDESQKDSLSIGFGFTAAVLE